MAKTKYAAEVQLLSDVAQAFAESLNLEATLKSILRSLDTHLKLRRGTITLLNPETETLDIEVAHGLSEKSKTLGSYKVGEGTGIEMPPYIIIIQYFDGENIPDTRHRP